MKKNARRIVILIWVSQLLLVPFPASPARADTRITITIAGGAACGVYFLLRFAFRTLVTTPQDPLDTAAFLNHGPHGWQIQFPTLDLTRSEDTNAAFPVGSPEMLQMDLLKVRF